MGLWDFFRKKEVPKLDAPKNLKQEKEPEREAKKEEKIDVHLFPKKVGENAIEYTIVGSRNGENINIGTLHSTETDNSFNGDNSPLKQIVTEIEDTINPILNVNTQHRLDRAKASATESLKDIQSKKLGFVLKKDIMEYIQEYEPSYELIKPVDYKKVKKFPKKVDITKLSPSEIFEWGESLYGRLEELEDIKTPKDAYENRDSLIDYMENSENEKSPLDALINASTESEKDGIELDDYTVERIAEQMEQFDNEDGFLYSAYLKLEESRIWKQIQVRIAQYSNESKDKDTIDGIYQLSNMIEKLDGYELQDTSGVQLEDIFGYIINEMKQLDVKNYIANYKGLDFKLAQTLNTKYGDMQDLKTILQFLYARMASMGQLSYKSNPESKGGGILRDFVINTDFKHEDNEESKRFLLLVSQIEKEYIKNECMPVIEAYMQAKGKQETSSEKGKVQAFKSTMTYDTNSTPYRSEQDLSQKQAMKQSSKVENQEIDGH